ncbi:MAG: helix-hairpin-helix domain-containing protein [Proteobacteria bacterium]|jgi:competence protein ComEA|nr:helix-hairpin-helix domain-containing protein [Pseudomonadota bacterium]
MKKGLQDPVNINRAKLIELVALPRIGPVLAVKIVEYKETYGLFEKVEDIRKVQGIGSGTFNAVRHYITVN